MGGLCHYNDRAMEIISLLLLLFGLLIAGAVLGFRAGLRWLRGHAHWSLIRLWQVLPLVWFVWAVVGMYWAIWPNEAFYRREFKRITNTPLPDAAEFQKKNATYPDIHGDYEEYVVIKLPDTAYQRLMHVVQRDTSWHATTHPDIISPIGWDVAALVPHFRLAVQAGKDGGIVFICFGEDGRTILFYRFSS